MTAAIRFLKQPSTWRGITWMLTLIGVALSPEQIEAIAVAGVAVVALIETFSDEDSRATVVNLPPIEMQSTSQFDERGFTRQSRHDQDDGYMSLRDLRTGLHVRAEDYPKEPDERGSGSGWNG